MPGFCSARTRDGIFGAISLSDFGFRLAESNLQNQNPHFSRTHRARNGAPELSNSLLKRSPRTTFRRRNRSVEWCSGMATDYRVRHGTEATIPRTRTHRRSRDHIVPASLLGQASGLDHELVPRLGAPRAGYARSIPKHRINHRTMLWRRSTSLRDVWT